MSQDNIFPFRTRRTAPRVRLFCLPFAGGSASLYRTWGTYLPEVVDVCPIELPGHGVRRTERPLAEMGQVVEAIHQAMAPLLDIPVAIFGHSMGARIGFPLARKLGSRVHHVFASASRAPDLPRGKPIARLPKDEFWREMRLLGGTPPAILEDADLREMVLPTLRADFSILESYLAAAGERLDCPVTVFAATQDTQVSIPEARRWQEFTSGAFRFVEVPHNHFFLDAAIGTLTQEIGSALSGIG